MGTMHEIVNILYYRGSCGGNNIQCTSLNDFKCKCHEISITYNLHVKFELIDML